MRGLARFLMLISLTVWVGGIVFFAFVLAPALFSILPSRELAGNVVSHTLAKLHWIGITAGVAFLVASLIASAMAIDRRRRSSVPALLITIMLLLTLASQFGVTRRMAALRSDMGVIDSVAANDPRRAEFNRLHQWSTALESGVLLFGIVAVAMMARE